MTEFHTAVGGGEYKLTFTTSEKEYYLLMQETARRCVDGKPVSCAPLPDKHDGLKVKYNVFKVSDGSVVNDCFVLRPDRDPAAVSALRAYAAATDNQALAADIIRWVGAPDNKALTVEELRKMDEQPVWVVFDDGSATWFLVDAGDIYKPLKLANNWGAQITHEEHRAHIAAIYRRPPEKGEP